MPIEFNSFLESRSSISKTVGWIVNLGELVAEGDLELTVSDGDLVVLVQNVHQCCQTAKKISCETKCV